MKYKSADTVNNGLVKNLIGKENIIQWDTDGLKIAIFSHGTDMLMATYVLWIQIV